MTQAKTKEAEVKTKALLPEPDIHHMVQKLGTQVMPDGTITVEYANENIRRWLRKGFRVAFVRSLGMEPNSINILYILIKDA